MTRFSHLRVYLMLFLVMLFWSGNAMAARAIHADIPPFTLALLRWSGATLVLLPLAWRSVIADWPAVRRHWPMILLLGVTGVSCFNAFLYTGLRTTTATNAFLIQASVPAMVIGWDFLLFRARATAVQIFAVLLSAAGALIIVFQADITALLTLRFGTGDALIVTGTIAWAIYISLLRLRPPLAAVTFLFLTFMVGAFTMAPLAAMEWTHQSIRWTPAVIGGAAYVAVFPSVISYFLFNHAVEEIGGVRTGQVISLQPLVGAVLAALILAEPLHGYHLAGMAVILLGIVIAARQAQPAGE